MAQVSQLPCDGDGICMLCNQKPSSETETLVCKTCVTPWHVSCLSSPPENLASTLHWDCPDCSPVSGPDSAPPPPPPPPPSGVSTGLLAAVRAIETDATLTEQEKAKKRQELMSGGGGGGGKGSEEDSDLDEEKVNKWKSDRNDVLELLDESLNCSFCMQLPDRPVTTPCGHNFCLKCFQKWTGQGKRTCAKCRSVIPPKMASQPRINASLVVAIRMAKMSKSISSGGPAKVYHFLHNENRPDKAFTTERAKKSGKANACSGKIFVTVPPDHFGPILAENDPVRNQGVLVGECWEDRMECRQWGAHLPHISGIAGQSDYGAQSVALSGGYEDDEDHGEWFLYTGSGGRDLSGNKRTNKAQSFDQKFDKMNEALRVSCKKGYPVRVVRSHKEKKSSYAPEKGVRYDGVYRIEKCWRKVGIQGFKVCRYLFVRCDNEPAPWTSDEQGDRPRPLPAISELKKATDITERKDDPSWGFDEEESCWKWTKPSPLSKKTVNTLNPEERKMARAAIRKTQNKSVRERLLKEFSCLICRKVMTLPLTTPCAHNFCKHCLEGAFAGQTFVRVRSAGRHTLRAQKNIMKCPACPTDISDFLKDPQVNRDLMGVIENLQQKTEEAEEDEGKEAEENAEASGNEDAEDDNENSELCGGSELGRATKRRKIDEKCKESETEAKKPISVNGDTEDTDVDACKAETPGQQKASCEDSVLKFEGEVNSMSNSSEDDEKGVGNDSPSSPLHV